MLFRLAKHEAGYPLWRSVATGLVNQRTLGTYTGTEQRLRSNWEGSGELTRHCFRYLSEDGRAHCLCCLGTRYTTKHWDTVEQLAEDANIREHHAQGEVIHPLGIVLTATRKEYLYRDLLGMYWYYAFGEGEERGACERYNCSGTVYSLPSSGFEMHCTTCSRVHYLCERCESTPTLNTYCASCQEDIDSCDPDEEEETSGAIHSLRSWDYKPSPQFFGSASRFPKLFFGHEIEMVSNDRDLVGDLTSKGEVYCKRDGSLDHNGLEVVTHPMTYEHSLGVLKFISETAKGAKSKAYSAPCSCGHHIHTPTTAWTDYAIHRALGAMALPEWKDMLTFISQRDPNALLQWASPTQLSKSAAARIAKYKCGSNDLGRYTAINVASRTIEFRLFRSNVVYDRLVKNMQFTLVTWHIAHSLLPFSRESLVDVCKQHHYLELLSFVKGRSKQLEAIRKGKPLEVASAIQDI